ncbi:MAG: hypothetical protein LC769_10695, partial [Chloroflexi bacterium]|nr:hypothetical protein [Chloroflexota bacterium]
MTLNHEQHLALGLGFLLVGLFITVWWLVSHLTTRRQTGHTWRDHWHRHGGTHLFAWALAGIGLALLLTAGTAYVLLHLGGARFDPHKHIAPPTSRHPAGGRRVGGYISPDLFARSGVVAYVVDQGQTESCCGQAIAEIDYLNRGRLYHETPRLPPTSGFKPWYYSSGGQNVGTTVE